METNELERSVLQSVMVEQGATGKPALDSSMASSLDLEIQQIHWLLEILEQKGLVTLARTSRNLIAFIEPKGRLLLSQRAGASTSVTDADQPGVLKIAFMGMTGSGKSTLINAILESNIANVNALFPGTKQVLYVSGQIENQNVILVDCPGLGWTEELDDEYFEVYRQTC